MALKAEVKIYPPPDMVSKPGMFLRGGEPLAVLDGQNIAVGEVVDLANTYTGELCQAKITNIDLGVVEMQLGVYLR